MAERHIISGVYKSNYFTISKGDSMVKIKFNNSNDYMSVNFSKNGHIVTLSGITVQNTSGFKTYRASDLLYLGDWSGFNTVYRVLDNAVQYSDDGSIYVEPTKDVVVSAVFNDVEPVDISVKVMLNGSELENVSLTADNDYKKEYKGVAMADNYTIESPEIEGYDMSISGTTVVYSEPAPYIPSVEEQLAELTDVIAELDERVYALEEA